MKEGLYIRKTIGKFLVVYALIKNDIVKTNHFKICDR